MTIASIWQTLADRLDRLQEAGESVDFWLRDDDAVEPTAALHRLLDLTDRFSVPVTLAVIPAGTDERLSRCLAGRPLVDVAVHGWSHQNHAPPTEKRQELGGHRSRDMIASDLRTGWARLRALYPAAMVPLLVPPWNRIDPALVPGLHEIGWTGGRGKIRRVTCSGAAAHERPCGCDGLARQPRLPSSWRDSSRHRSPAG